MKIELVLTMLLMLIPAGLASSENTTAIVDRTTINESDPGYWYNKSLALYCSSETYGAQKACNKAIELDPHLTKAWIQKAIVLGVAYKDVDDALNHAIRLNPKSENLRIALWLCQSFPSGLNKQEFYLNYLNNKIALNKSNYVAMILKGAFLAMPRWAPRFNEAIESYDMAIAINPKLIDAWIGKGVALYGLGNYNESLKAFDEAIKIVESRNYFAPT